MVMIEEPCFCFQIKGKDVILKVAFVAAGMDRSQWQNVILDNDKFWKKVKCSHRVGGIDGEELASLIREKDAWWILLSLDCLLRLKALKFQLLFVGLAGSVYSRREVNPDRRWGRVQWGKLLWCTSTGVRREPPFCQPLAFWLHHADSWNSLAFLPWPYSLLGWEVVITWLVNVWVRWGPGSSPSFPSMLKSRSHDCQCRILSFEQLHWHVPRQWPANWIVHLSSPEGLLKLRFLGPTQSF